MRQPSGGTSVIFQPVQVSLLIDVTVRVFSSWLMLDPQDFRILPLLRIPLFRPLNFQIVRQNLPFFPRCLFFTAPPPNPLRHLVNRTQRTRVPCPQDGAHAQLPPFPGSHGHNTAGVEGLCPPHSPPIWYFVCGGECLHLRFFFARLLEQYNRSQNGRKFRLSYEMQMFHPK